MPHVGEDRATFTLTPSQLTLLENLDNDADSTELTLRLKQCCKLFFFDIVLRSSSLTFLFTLSSLCNLELSHCPINAELHPLLTLRNLVSLTSLQSVASLTSTSLVGLKDMTQLLCLEISYAPLRTIHDVKFLTRLERLYLRCTELDRLPRLEYLTRLTDVTCDRNLLPAKLQWLAMRIYNEGYSRAGPIVTHCRSVTRAAMRRLVDLVLVFAPMRLPSYVLLAIFEHLPGNDWHEHDAEMLAADRPWVRDGCLIDETQRKRRQWHDQCMEFSSIGAYDWELIGTPLTEKEMIDAIIAINETIYSNRRLLLASKKIMRC
jgi:hypothetical protein